MRQELKIFKRRWPKGSRVLLLNAPYDVEGHALIAGELLIILSQTHVGNKFMYEFPRDFLEKYGVRSPFSRLATREMQVTRLLLRGMKSEQIAQELKINRRTVDGAKRRAIKKLDVENDIQLAILASQHGIFNEIEVAK